MKVNKKNDKEVNYREIKKKKGERKDSRQTSTFRLPGSPPGLFGRTPMDLYLYINIQ